MKKKAPSKDLSGNRYGFWTVLRFSGYNNKGNAYWLSKCKCGVKKEVLSHGLTSGRSKSCGCKKQRHDARLTGKVFGRLKVLGRSHIDRNRQCHWHVICECGTKKTVPTAALNNASVRSCGCLRDESTARRSTKHGMYLSREYKSWQAMKARCLNPNNAKFSLYGGRGITICKRWLDSFDNFFSDMGPRPEGMTLDRRDSNGDYEPSNCRWATAQEQSSNIRSNIFITYNGSTKTISQWAKAFGLNFNTLNYRIKSNWSVKEALTKKPKYRRK